MGDLKNFLLVVNPISGDIDKSTLVKKVMAEASKRGASLFIFQTTGEEDVRSLKNIIDKKAPQRVLVAGGDGTIKIVAEAIQERPIPMGIIPAGSANGLSVNLKLPPKLEEQIEVAFGDNFMAMDIILIEDEYCLHMSDFGLNAELIRKYENSSIRGKLGYLLQSIPTLLESDYPFNFKVESNGEIIERKGILLALANAQSYGTGATVNPTGRMDDGKFEILIFKNFDMLEIINTLRDEVELDPDFVEIISTSEAVISCDSPVAFQIDGEYLGRRKIVKACILTQKTIVAIPKSKNFYA